MKKVLKALLTLSLSSMVLTQSVIIAQESVEEEAPVEETVAEEEAGETEETVEIETPETSEIPEELINSINEANQVVESKRLAGFLDLAFGDGEAGFLLNSIDYSIAHNSEEPLSAELNLVSTNPEGESVFQYFAYLYQGYVIENQGEQWIIDDASTIEPFFVNLLLNSEPSEVDLKAKYFDYYESEQGYHLVLKDDINTEELWSDLNSVYNLETARDNIIEILNVQSEVAGVEVDPTFGDVLNTLISPEKLDQILADNPSVELLYDLDSYKLINTYFTLNVNVEDVYSI